ncbi:uncharacterized protein LY89DRAFT_35229 [Mollisia scopiformis]|uniref:Secreted protein n=1 Tax=Mollisia scopiformis TaxID=149040 RepID=A0A194XE26_MOLSC|nr:uncharacterized protein LY89DRAFT_35229 [Mollisia scopiformis]KUJ18007.1 hypothetical protein LY89DRAFT_35229 [Mollisia scopiformis]
MFTVTTAALLCSMLLRERAWEADNIVLFPFPMCVAVTPVHQHICSLPLSARVRRDLNSSIGESSLCERGKRTGMYGSYQWSSWAFRTFEGAAR